MKIHHDSVVFFQVWPFPWNLHAWWAPQHGFVGLDLGPLRFEVRWL